MPSTRSVCGEFDEATRIDYGQCHPRRLKLDCEDPYPISTVIISPIEGETCEDPNLTTENHPELVPSYRIVGTIFDTECDPILDENDEPVTGPTF